MNNANSVVMRAANDTLTAQLHGVTTRLAAERADSRARIEALEHQTVLLLKARSQ